MKGQILLHNWSICSVSGGVRHTGFRQYDGLGREEILATLNNYDLESGLTKSISPIQIYTAIVYQKE